MLLGFIAKAQFSKSDIFVFGASQDYTQNELIRADLNGNVLWQTTMPIDSLYSLIGIIIVVILISITNKKTDASLNLTLLHSSPLHFYKNGEGSGVR